MIRQNAIGSVIDHQPVFRAWEWDKEWVEECEWSGYCLEFAWPKMERKAEKRGECADESLRLD